jgi:hypothetical protein
MQGYSSITPVDFARKYLCHPTNVAARSVIRDHHLTSPTAAPSRKAQTMAAHESPRTTKLYDRTTDAVSPDEVARVAF